MPIRLCAMSTLATGTRGVRRVNEPHVHTSPGGLVGDVHAELIEGPGMPLVAMFTPNRCPLSNAGEVLESQCLARYDGFSYQGLTDLVVDVFLKTLLTSTQLFETAFGRTGPDPLQLLTACVITLSNLMDFGTCKGLACAIGGKVDDAQIDTDGGIGLSDLGGISALGQM